MEKEKQKIQRQRALEVAEAIVEELRPGCERVEIAGSLRRKKSEVKDIEIVCIPKKESAGNDLFGASVEERSPQFYLPFERWKVIKGQPRHGKYIQAEVQGITVDVFTATPNNWGWIFAIRTGPADFSHHTLASQLRRCGYKALDGFIYRRDALIPVREERELFMMLNVKWIRPEYRR